MLLGPSVHQRTHTRKGIHTSINRQTNTPPITHPYPRRAQEWGAYDTWKGRDDVREEDGSREREGERETGGGRETGGFRKRREPDAVQSEERRRNLQKEQRRGRSEEQTS